MNPNEIGGYVAEGIKWIAIGGAVYSVALIGAQTILDTTLFRTKIESQEELEGIVNEEAKKLNIDPTMIKAIYGDKSPRIKKRGEGYALYISGDWNATRPAVKHELYHIFRGHAEDNMNIKSKSWTLDKLDHWFRREFQATLYSLTNIRL